MSAASTIVLIIVTAAIIGAVIETVRLWLHDDELNEIEKEESND